MIELCYRQVPESSSITVMTASIPNDENISALTSLIPGAVVTAAMTYRDLKTTKSVFIRFSEEKPTGAIPNTTAYRVPEDTYNVYYLEERLTYGVIHEVLDWLYDGKPFWMVTAGGPEYSELRIMHIPAAQPPMDAWNLSTSFIFQQLGAGFDILDDFLSGQPYQKVIPGRVIT